MELALAYMTVTAALVVTAFVAYYAFTLKWEDSPAGRSMMSASASTMLLAWCGVAQRYDEHHVSVDWRETMRPLLFGAWFVVAVVYAWRGREVHRSKRDKDRDDED